MGIDSDSESIRFELYRKGYNDREIGEIIGTTSENVRRWRIRRQLSIHIKFQSYDTPEQIAACQKCPLKECIDCIGTKKSKESHRMA